MVILNLSAPIIRRSIMSSMALRADLAACWPASLRKSTLLPMPDVISSKYLVGKRALPTFEKLANLANCAKGIKAGYDGQATGLYKQLHEDINALKR